MLTDSYSEMEYISSNVTLIKLIAMFCKLDRAKTNERMLVMMEETYMKLLKKKANKKESKTGHNKKNKQMKRKGVNHFFLRNISIGNKYLLIFSISVVLFITATVVVHTQMSNANNHVINAINKSEITDTVTQLAILVERQDSVITNYYIVGGKKYIEEFEEITKQLHPILEQLEHEFKNNETYEFLINRFVDRQHQIEELFYSDLTDDSLSEEERSLIHISYTSLKTSYVALINDIIEDINEERDLSTINALTSMDHSVLFLMIVNAVSIAIGFIIMIIMSKVISTNLKKIVAKTNEIADGQLTVGKIDYEGKDEIGQLHRAINTLSQNMRNIIQEVHTAAQSTASSSDMLARSSYEMKQGSDQMVLTMEELASGAEIQ